MTPMEDEKLAWGVMDAVPELPARAERAKAAASVRRMVEVVPDILMIFVDVDLVS